MKIKLALGGSGFLLPVYAGVFSACDAYDVIVEEMATVSGGAISAAIWLVNGSRYFSDLVLATDFSTLMDFTSLTDVFRIFNSGGWCSSAVVDAFLLQHTNGMKFSDLQINLKMIATSLVDGTGESFSQKSSPAMLLATGARASSSLPLIYPAKNIDGVYYADGGMSCNVPAPFLSSGGQSVSIQLVGTEPSIVGQPDVKAMAALSLRSMLHSQERFDISTTPLVTHLSIDTGNLSMLDTSMSTETKKALIQKGYNAMEAYIKTHLSSLSNHP